MNVINWLLNDKDAAQFMLKVIKSGDEPITTSEAKTFYGRMRAFIIGNLARNNTRINAFVYDEEAIKKEREKQKNENL